MFFLLQGRRNEEKEERKNSRKREKIIVDGRLYCVKGKGEKEKFYDQKDYCLILTYFMISASDD